MLTLQCCFTVHCNWLEFQKRLDFKIFIWTESKSCHANCLKSVTNRVLTAQTAQSNWYFIKMRKRNNKNFQDLNILNTYFDNFQITFWLPLSPSFLQQRLLKVLGREDDMSSSYNYTSNVIWRKSDQWPHQKVTLDVRLVLTHFVTAHAFSF